MDLLQSVRSEDRAVLLVGHLVRDPVQPLFHDDTSKREPGGMRVQHGSVVDVFCRGTHLAVFMRKSRWSVGVEQLEQWGWNG